MLLNSPRTLLTGTGIPMKFIKILLLVLFPVSGFAQQVTWDVSLWGKRRAFTEHVEKLSELVAQKTNGEFILKLSYGGLSKPTENLDGISAGLFEMAQFCAGYHKEKNPSITVLELPFLGVNTLAEERTISQWLYRHPAVRADFRKWNAIALMPSPLPQYNLIGVGKTPESLRQLAGLNVRATGGIGRAMEALGAYPTSIVATGVRQALETGEINAVAFAPHAHISFGTIASATWWTTNLNPGTVNCPVVANLEALSQLSKQHRDALYGSINEALDYYISHYEYNMRESWEPVLSKLSIEKVTFNELELNFFQERVEKPAAQEWIEEHERNGLPAKQIYNLVKVALTGENPEQAQFADNAWKNIDQTDNIAEQQRTEKQALLDTYSFNKTDSALTVNTTLPIAEDTSAVDNPIELPADLQLPISGADTGFIQGGISALFVNDRVPDQNDNSNDVTKLPIVKTAANPVGNYFGAPRNGADNTFDADPLKMLVEWDLEDQATVGLTIARLSDYIGYELLTTDQTAINIYERKLPSVQRKVNNVNVIDAFQILSGRGLVTVFDHTYRTVKHVPMRRQSATNLPPCPADLNINQSGGDGVILLPDGSQCSN